MVDESRLQGLDRPGNHLISSPQEVAQDLQANKIAIQKGPVMAGGKSIDSGSRNGDADDRKAGPARLDQELCFQIVSGALNLDLSQKVRPDQAIPALRIFDLLAAQSGYASGGEPIEEKTKPPHISHFGKPGADDNPYPSLLPRLQEPGDIRGIVLPIGIQREKGIPMALPQEDIEARTQRQSLPSVAGMLDHFRSRPPR
jgi:hypothetical protein